MGGPPTAFDASAFKERLPARIIMQDGSEDKPERLVLRLLPESGGSYSWPIGNRAGEQQWEWGGTERPDNEGRTVHHQWGGKGGHSGGQSTVSEGGNEQAGVSVACTGNSDDRGLGVRPRGELVEGVASTDRLPGFRP